MLGMLSCAAVVGLELIILTTLLKSASADCESSLIAKFCGSVWPGVILFITLALTVLFTVGWWWEKF